MKRIQIRGGPMPETIKIIDYETRLPIDDVVHVEIDIVPGSLATARVTVQMIVQDIDLVAVLGSVVVKQSLPEWMR